MKNFPQKHYSFSANSGRSVIQKQKGGEAVSTGNSIKDNQSRRRFLKLAGSATLLGAGLAASPLLAGSILAEEEEADFVIESGFSAGNTFLSPVRAVRQAYTAVGSYWEMVTGDGSQVELALRTSQDGTNFSDWRTCPCDLLESPIVVNRTRFFGRLQFVNAPYVQFKLEIPAGTRLKLAGLGFIDGGATRFPLANQNVVPQFKIPSAPFIIKRADWGADESLRFGSVGEIWPAEYRYPKVVIVHHSDTGDVDRDDPPKVVRSIYRYHAVTQGWGDIGYNFLIDWQGNIYEGRSGGPNVVGGHAYQYSYGSIGICLLGSFETSGPTAEQVDALVRLVAYHASTQDINPLAETFFIDRTVSTIIGHRDVINTACPGDAGYAILPDVRQRVAALAGQTNAEVQLKSLSITPSTVRQGGIVKVEAVITNTGKVTVETQEPKPNFVYQEGQTYQAAALGKVDNKFRLALDFTGNEDITYPYRWGFGKSLAPGETVTVTGFIQMRNFGSIELFGGLVQENIKYLAGQVGTTHISTIAGGPNRTEQAPSRATEPNTIYFAETGHNLRGVFLDYWNQNGGLALFGLPLTEEFEEASDTESGKSLMVQYFQRNRFEYHPEFKGTKDQVLLGLLGTQLTVNREFPMSVPFKNTASKVYFQTTRHSLEGAFYRYWQAHGGLAIFGYPISEEFEEQNPDDGQSYTVQYFERNRFEYHPEFKGTNSEVLLGLLGTELCRRKGWL
ncbi:MAG TPA: peptidoglycan recognition family protein [Chloroflexia bacterium]|nr:peptidoglycan recognition family protein [Chloroflexia bacterium]